jgi:DNA invertase Pin-like site-specific DNA recombinase
VLAAVAQFERRLISERIKDAKRNLRCGNRHQGGKRPFGWRYGPVTGTGRARDLVPDEEEQAAFAEIRAMREAVATLVAIRDAMRNRGFLICKQSVLNILNRQGAAADAPTRELTSSPPSPSIRWPDSAVDKTDEALRAGGRLTIIGAPRPVHQ